jgi:hypothetical protein
MTATDIEKSDVIVPSAEDIAFSAWDKQFATVTMRAVKVQWDVADLWLEGRNQFGDRAADARALDGLPYTKGTLDNYATVAKAFPAGKRNLKVSWGVHVILTSVANRDDIADMLATAAREQWTVAIARTMLRELTVGNDAASDLLSIPLQMRWAAQAAKYLDKMDEADLEALRDEIDAAIVRKQEQEMAALEQSA